MKITKEEIVKLLQALLISGIMGIGIFYGFFFIAEIITQKENAAIEKHKAIAEGRVTDRTDYVKGRLVYVEFYRDGIRHETKMGCSDCVENEYYPIAYDSTNISTLVVQQPNLFFKPNQPTSFSEGRITNIRESGGTFPDIDFEYIVNGQTYAREQEFYSVSNFKLGQVYEIEYLVSRPQAAILCPDNYKRFVTPPPFSMYDLLYNIGLFIGFAVFIVVLQYITNVVFGNEKLVD